MSGASGVLTIAGASGGSTAISLSSDPFGLAMASQFAALTASYASASPAVFSYPTDTAALRIAADQGLTIVNGAVGSSALLVGDGDTLAYHGDGDATVLSGSGDDTITAGAGSADTIDAGTGHNVIDVSLARAAFVSSDGSDLVTAGSGTDTVAIDGVGTSTTINGGTGALRVENQGAFGTAVHAGAGNALFIGNGGSTTVTGGQDTLYGGGGGTFALTGSTHGNYLVANAGGVINSGSVVLDGSEASGGNGFWAGAGNATLIGGLGADTLVAGTGLSTMTGGAGAGNDFGFFTVQGGSAVEATITDFAAASGNVITLYDYGQAGITTALDSATQVGNDTHLTLGDGTRIVLSNFAADTLTRADFAATGALPVTPRV